MHHNHNHREGGGGGEEAIVDKLHGVMAALRRERDDLHRKKALAEERLALFQEEKEALEKTHTNARIKLEALKTSGNEDAIREVTELEHEVIRLNKEVRSFECSLSDFGFLFLNTPIPNAFTSCCPMWSTGSVPARGARREAQQGPGYAQNARGRATETNCDTPELP